jgi:hypothetical protein
LETNKFDIFVFVQSSRHFISLVPNLTARALALVQLHKFFRWKQVAIIVAGKYVTIIIDFFLLHIFIA